MVNGDNIEIQEVEENFTTVDELRQQKAGLEDAIKVTVSKLIMDFTNMTGVEVVGIEIGLLQLRHNPIDFCIVNLGI